jgi:hypothetical protein
VLHGAATGIWSRALLALALGAAVAAAWAGSAGSAQAGTRTCVNDYSYAGFQSANRGHGVRATLAALQRPQVHSGHVAAWVGVGGPGQGPNRSDQWLQVGMSAFSDGNTSLYYEFATGGRLPEYVEVMPNVPSNKRLRVAVLEMSKRPGWWRVWVGRNPVSPPIHLPGSSGRFEPIATAESWGAGSRACNAFTYRFDKLGVAGARGGSWRRFVQAHRFLDPGYRVMASSPSASSFVARS